MYFSNIILSFVNFSRNDQINKQEVQVKNVIYVSLRLNDWNRNYRASSEILIHSGGSEKDFSV